MELLKKILIAAQACQDSGFVSEANQLDKIATKIEKKSEVDMRQLVYEFESAIQTMSDFIANERGGELGSVVPKELLLKTINACNRLRSNIPTTDKWGAFRAYVEDLCSYVIMMEGQKLQEIEAGVAYVLQNLPPLKRALSTLAPI